TILPTDGTGTITFYDSGTQIASCINIPVVSAVAKCNITVNTYNNDVVHMITASYSGDINHYKSTSTVLQQYILIPTTWNVDSNVNPAIINSQIIYTATTNVTQSLL